MAESELIVTSFAMEEFAVAVILAFVDAIFAIVAVILEFDLPYFFKRPLSKFVSNNLIFPSSLSWLKIP